MELYIHSRNTPSWCGAQLKKSTGSTLPFNNILQCGCIIISRKYRFYSIQQTCWAKLHFLGAHARAHTHT